MRWYLDKAKKDNVLFKIWPCKFYLSLSQYELVRKTNGYEKCMGVLFIERNPIRWGVSCKSWLGRDVVVVVGGGVCVCVCVHACVCMCVFITLLCFCALLQLFTHLPFPIIEPIPCFQLLKFFANIVQYFPHEYFSILLTHNIAGMHKVSICVAKLVLWKNWDYHCRYLGIALLSDFTWYI